MERGAGQREAIAEAAARLAPSRRYWAVVGNGPNRIAAAEVRIKLSELCYKSIACDAHRGQEAHRPVLRAADPGVRGRAVGPQRRRRGQGGGHLPGPQGGAGRDRHRGRRAAVLGRDLHVIEVPAVDPALAFVLSAMAGHLFGYEAALSIDAQARPLREARAAVEAAVSLASGGGLAGTRLDGDRLLAELHRALTPAAAPFFEGLRAGSYNGHLEAGTAVRRRLAAALRHRAAAGRGLRARVRQGGHAERPGRRPARGPDRRHRRADPPGRRHQAPGQDRHRRHLPQRGRAAPGPAGHRRCWPPAPSQDRLSYRALRTLAELDPAVAAVRGFTRYRIEGGIDDGATIHVIDRGGIACRHAVADRSRPAAAGHQAPGRRGAGGHRGQGPQRRAHGDPRARDQGRRR